VATEILSRADPREQARVISKFIKIARLCYQLYNFNSLSEILTGLNNSAVIRLKGTSSLPQTHRMHRTRTTHNLTLHSACQLPGCAYRTGA
jgi:hypothetical protein